MISLTRKLSAYGLTFALVLGSHAGTANANELFTESEFGEFDIGYRFQSLEADVIQDAYVETTGLNILSLRFTPNISPLLGFFLAYEFTPGNSAEQDQLVALQSSSASNGWKRLLANFVVGVTDQVGIGFRYDDQSFLNSVQSKRDLWFVTPSTAQLLIPGDDVTVATVFTDIELYVAMMNGTSSFDIGWFSTEYSKPLATDALTTVTTLFESELAASGLFVRATDFPVSKDWRLTATAKYAFEPEVKIDGQNLGLISGGSISTVNTLTYLEYGFSLTYKSSVYSMPLNVRVDYTARQFDDIVDSLQITDDTIFGLSASILWSL